MISEEKESKKDENDKSNQDNENTEVNDEEIYNTLLTHMKNLQPKASKKIKRKTYNLILTFVNESPLSQRCLDLMIKGDRHLRILGLCELVSKKTTGGNFKGSTNEIIKIIHDWMILSGVSDKITTEFAINEEYVARMNLGEHFSVLSNSSKKEKKQLAQKVIKIIKAIIEKRPSLELNDLVREGFVEMIQESLNQYTIEKKEEEEQNKEMEYVENIVDEVINTISMEPRTWEDVEKSNKKLLTCDFLSNENNQFIDEEKEAELELIDNFIDPLNNNAHLNIKSYNDEELQKLHIQMETFDPAFFLEKFYKEINLNQFGVCLTNIDNNLQEINQRDETLIDKNIYKYLDCKKLLDNILQKFNNETNNLMTQFNTQASSLKFAINDKLSNVKKSFEMIIQSKMSKEIIMKFAKYFVMKDKIEHCLKFSDLEELADYLKKINVEIKDISQNRLIYGEFYEYFSKYIENFKNILIDIIKVSPVNENSLKYFKYLLEFDVETDTIDTLINDQKTKMCDKIKNYLEFTDNLEIKNIKSFFCDEYVIESLPDEQYSKFIKEAEREQYQTKQSSFNMNELQNNNNEQFQPKKESINVESIIKSLLKEINDFLFTMKVLDESLDLKPTYLQRDTKFDTIATEIYFVLFDKLKLFLFNTNFSMEEVIEDNYSKIYPFGSNENITKILEFYNDNKELKNVIFNESFNKNSLQNLSNLIIEIFEKFEYHLSTDIIDSLSENKSVIIDKIFIAFVNEKINNTILFFSNENTIDFADTQMSIFNYSSFSFTKNFLKLLCKNFRSVLQFYMNIVTKIKVKLNHEIIYLTFFFVIKCFITRFYTFYQTEKKYSTEDIKLNCLIVETLRNFNYIQYELSPVLKFIFKNKEKDYQTYYEDLVKFITNMRNIFIDEYVANAAQNLLTTYINLSTKIENTKYNFYDKYNSLLISNKTKNNKGTAFQDSRSVLIEIVANVANCLRDFDIINTENPNITNKDEESNKVIKNIIELFYDKILSYINDNEKLLLGQYENDEENKKNSNINLKDINPFKYLSQLYLEFDIFNHMLFNYSSLLTKKVNFVKENLLGLIYKTKNISDKQNAEEKTVYSNDDIDLKNSLIEVYTKNYSSLFKCFINKTN